MFNLKGRALHPTGGKEQQQHKEIHHIDHNQITEIKVSSTYFKTFGFKRHHDIKYGAAFAPR